MYVVYCSNSTCENLLIGPQKKWCSPNCKLTQFRRELKIKAVNYKGGCCELCGYKKCVQALDFHHKDPNEKDFGIAASGQTRSWTKLMLELDKCALVCRNCHAELHAGLVTI